MSTEQKPWTHPWEPWHGKAPFRCVDFYQSIFQPHPDTPPKGGSSCDVCGNGIMNVFVVESSDGHRFKVGIDCVEHTTDSALIAEAKGMKRVYRTPEQIEKAKREQEEKDRREQAERDARALQYAQEYSEVIRDATAAAGVAHVPGELREIAEKTLQGLVTGVWRKGPDKKWIKDVTTAAEIARLPAWENKDEWLDAKQGDKLTNLRVLIEARLSFEGRYGWSHITKFRVIEGSEAGKLLIWYNAIGSKYEVMSINATVDGVVDYQGEKQTKLSRVTEYVDPATIPVFKPGEQVVYAQSGGWGHPAIVESKTKAGKYRIRYRWKEDAPLARTMAQYWEIRYPNEQDKQDHDWSNLGEEAEPPYESPFAVGERVLFQMQYDYRTESLPAIVIAITKTGKHRVKFRGGVKLVEPEKLTKLTPELAEGIAEWQWEELT